MSGYSSVHLLHQLPHNGKPQTGPALGTGGAALIKAVKQVLRLGRGVGKQPVGKADHPILAGDRQSPAAVAQSRLLYNGA